MKPRQPRSAAKAPRVSVQPSPPTPPRRSSRAWRVLGAIIVVSTIWYLSVSSSIIAQAELALGRGDYRNALSYANQELQAHPDSDRALLVAGLACIARQDLGTAMACLQQVSDKTPELFGLAQREFGRIALNAGHAAVAEQRLRQALQILPGDSQAKDQLIYLLTLEGRIGEARDLIFEQLRAGTVSTNYLVITGKSDPNLELAAKYAERCLQVAPDEPLPKLGLAHRAWRDSQSDKAKMLLEQVLKTHPDSQDALALLCRVTVATGSAREFEELIKRLPEESLEHPEIWLSRGVFAQNCDQLEAAARCFWEALRGNPNLIDANYRLSQVLMKLGRSADATVFADRARKLTTLSQTIPTVPSDLDLQTLPSLINQLETLGREWEAAAWCQVVLLENESSPAWIQATLTRLSPRLLNGSTATMTSFDPSLQADLSTYPIPTFSAAPQSSVRSPQRTVSSAMIESSKITFQDVAGQSGLRFTYHNGSSQNETESLLEMNGGGIAVLDYDGDHWPDVFLTQGGRLPPAPFDPAQSDQLFRNNGTAISAESASTPFLDVTGSATLPDIGYGQGVTVGDVDNDGFPDLYVANIGNSLLLRNNGDGTFSDITDSAGVQKEGWASSSVLADFNRDGLPDLYVVTYLAGKTPYETCQKQARALCSPLSHPAESDRCYLNLGDGRFQDVSNEHGLKAPDGRGLGVVAADFDGSGRLSLFVANDLSPNFFFRNLTQAPDQPQFEEQALFSGLAFDQLGHVKSCMGVAAGDYNLDQRIDLFVTNYYRESNDLYTQQPDGTFQDLSREAKLADRTFSTLGWGTQFIDGDLDGYPDLIVANGHVHDPVDPAIPYYMNAQFFRNQGNGQFTELAGESLGEYFQQKLLGRPLARLDWNRDGKEDICITHLNDPAALLSNTTSQTGQSVTFRLVAVNSARDAIGTTVRIRSGDRIWTRQLTAGDGFQASNERQLVFGLGRNENVDSVEVLWPSGQKQTFPNLKLNREWLLIEQGRPLELTKPSGRYAD